MAAADAPLPAMTEEMRFAGGRWRPDVLCYGRDLTEAYLACEVTDEAASRLIAERLGAAR